MEGLRPAFPASLSTLASWTSDLGERRLQVKTIKAYLTGVRSAHINIGFDDLKVFHHPMLQRIIAGIRRMRGEAGVKERRPITRDLLLLMLANIDKTTRLGANLHAAFCLAFAGFLRIGEFTYSINDRSDPEFAKWFLTRRSVAFYKDYIELSLPASKTDPFRQGVTILIASASDDACPISSLQNLFNRFPAPKHAPLFDAGVGFSRQWVTQMLRDILMTLGITGNYSGHSFRRGAATSARDAGLTEDRIMLLGRWRSDSYKLYIETHPQHILAASRRLQGQ